MKEDQIAKAWIDHEERKDWENGIWRVFKKYWGEKANKNASLCGHDGDKDGLQEKTERETEKCYWYTVNYI